MKATGTAHGGREYRYYVCRRKQCATKSVSALAIEASVRAQVRAAMEGEDLRQRWRVSDQEWQALEAGDGQPLLRRLIRQIAFEGTTGRVSLELNAIEELADHDD